MRTEKAVGDGTPTLPVIWDGGVIVSEKRPSGVEYRKRPDVRHGSAEPDTRDATGIQASF